MENPASVRRKRRIRRTAAIFGVLALPALGIAFPGAAASAGPAAVTKYVALGDSYTSGPGIPAQRSDSGLCTRSDHNYPSLLAQSLSPATFTDVSCSAAVTDNMTQGQFGAPPQFDALDSNTDLVTVGIGGNDVGFAGIVVTCVALSFVNNNGSPCKDNYTSGGTDQIGNTIIATAPKIAAVVQGIHQRAPRARVLVVGYPAIMPDDRAKCDPANPNRTLIAAGDASWLVAKEQQLNQMLATQAAANGAAYVDTFTAGVGHDACQAAGTRWMEGILDVQNAIPVHPNALGMQNDARQVQAGLG
jgi:lysophospholipase L1-like esterase